MARDHLSVSQITCYLQCSLKYAFRYIEEREPERFPVALAFGKAMHATLESFHESRMNQAELDLPALQSLFKADWAAECSQPLDFGPKESAETLLGTGLELIAQYVAACPFVPTAVEEAFRVPLIHPETGEELTDLPLVGIFDLLTADGFVELKTGRQVMAESLRERNLQLSAYAYVYERMFGTLPKVSLVFLLKLKTPRVEILHLKREERDIRVFLHTAEAVAEGIQHELFAPNPGLLCASCEYQMACHAWNGPAWTDDEPV